MTDHDRAPMAPFDQEPTPPAAIPPPRPDEPAPRSGPDHVSVGVTIIGRAGDDTCGFDLARLTHTREVVCDALTTILPPELVEHEDLRSVVTDWEPGDVQPELGILLDSTGVEVWVQIEAAHEPQPGLAPSTITAARFTPRGSGRVTLTVDVVGHDPGCRRDPERSGGCCDSAPSLRFWTAPLPASEAALTLLVLVFAEPLCLTEEEAAHRILSQFEHVRRHEHLAPGGHGVTFTVARWDEPRATISVVADYAATARRT